MFMFHQSDFNDKYDKRHLTAHMRYHYDDLPRDEQGRVDFHKYGGTYVMGLFEHDGKLLMLRRSEELMRRIYPGKEYEESWGGVSGLVNTLGLGILGILLKESREETGIDEMLMIKYDASIRVLERFTNKKFEVMPWFTYPVVVHFDRKPPIDLQSSYSRFNEHDKYEWVPFSQVQQLHLHNAFAGTLHRQHVREALGRQFEELYQP